MQYYNRLYGYIDEYWKLLYDFYSVHGNAYPVTYYNIDQENTVWDTTRMYGGSYEQIGLLSGIRWNKILLLPVFQISETNTIFDAQEIGLVNESTLDLVIPSTYGITPNANDMVKVYQNKLFTNSSDDVISLFQVGGIEKQSSADKTFWKIKCNVFQSQTQTELDKQVINTYVFFDYDKKIHTVSQSQTLTKLLSKNESLRSNLKNLFDQNSGWFYI